MDGMRWDSWEEGGGVRGELLSLAASTLAGDLVGLRDRKMHDWAESNIRAFSIPTCTYRGPECLVLVRLLLVRQGYGWGT